MGPFSSWFLFVPSAVGSRRCSSGHNKEQHKATTALEVFPQPPVPGVAKAFQGVLWAPQLTFYMQMVTDFNCTSRREEKGSSGWLPEEPCSQHSSLHLWDAKRTAHRKSFWRSFEKPELKSKENWRRDSRTQQFFSPCMTTGDLQNNMVAYVPSA